MTTVICALLTMVVLGLQFDNLYSPATIAAAPDLRLGGGWATTHDADDYLAALAGGADLTAIVGPDKLWRLDRDGRAALALAVPGWHVNDPTLVAIPGASPCALPTLYVYFTGLPNTAADPVRLEASRIGLAISTDAGQTWTFRAWLAPPAPLAGAWLPAALRVDEAIWLYMTSETGGLWRQRLALDGLTPLAAAEWIGTPGVNVDVARTGTGYTMVANSYDLTRIEHLTSPDGLLWTSQKPLVVTPAPGIVPTPHLIAFDGGATIAIEFGYDPTGYMHSTSLHRWTFQCE